ncbi:MAG: DNA primase noncatalytic subunit PriX [Nitrososphaeria archaeon]
MTRWDEELLRLAIPWWVVHARGEFPTYGWERTPTGPGPWKVVDSAEALIRELRAAVPAGNEYHVLVNPGAVLPRREDPVNPYSISKILFEIDGADVDESLAGARALTHLLEDHYGARPRVYFSGRRSLHIYADFRPVPLDPRDPAGAYSFVYKRTVSRILSNLRETGVSVPVDPAFGATAKHMVRLPFVRHHETNLLSIPVDPERLPDLSADAIRAAAADPLSAGDGVLPPTPILSLSGALHDLVAGLAMRFRPAPEPRPHDRTPSEGEAPHRIDWIEALLEKGVPEGRRRLLWRVVSYYLVTVRGLSRDDAVAAARAWLERCDALRPVDRGLMRLGVRNYIANAEGEKLRPMSYWRFVRENPDLLEVLRPFEGLAGPEEGADPEAPPRGDVVRYSGGRRRRNLIPEDEV